MKKHTILLALAGSLLVMSGHAFGATQVIEEITGSPGDWTYTFTLTNDEALPIYNWAVWFPSDPNAISVTASDSHWMDSLATHGFFPEQYISEGYADHVYDSTADPFHSGTPNNLAGPNGEPGFYQIFSEDYATANAGEYWDGDSWEPLPETEPLCDDPLWDKFWRGYKYGYDLGWTEGAGGNVQTAYGIPNGATSQLIVNASVLITGTKSFSFNTTEYYYSINDWAMSGPDIDIYVDFEGSGTVVPEPATVSVLGLGGLAVLIGRKK